MKKLIRKILKESEVNSDFEWVENIPEVELGSFFKENDVVFEYDSKYLVNLLEDKVIYHLDLDKFKKMVNDSYDDWVLDTLVLNNGNYVNQYYDDYMDNDEINYLGGYLTQEQIDNLDNIFDRLGLEKTTNDYIEDSSFSDVGDILGDKFYSGRHDWDDFTNESLSSIGSAIERNRWSAIGEDYLKTLRDNNINIDGSYYNEEVVVTVPFPYDDITNLSEILSIGVYGVLGSDSWSDSFYDNWDSSDSSEDIRYAFDLFLEKIEGELDKLESDPDYIKPQKPDPNQLNLF